MFAFQNVLAGHGTEPQLETALTVFNKGFGIVDNKKQKTLSLPCLVKGGFSLSSGVRQASLSGKNRLELKYVSGKTVADGTILVVVENEKVTEEPLLFALDQSALDKIPTAKEKVPLPLLDVRVYSYLAVYFLTIF